ncbi:dTDP-glucose 4,6-dehydratase [Hyphomicrobium sp. ghe19]|nr:dTDP-glucose 4,6-dehydratase [Hyphomicrobium sp. ghe19]
MQSKENLKWLGASLDLVQTFQEYGGRRALVVGSSAEYDWAGGICLNGVTPMRPATIYGAAKLSLNIALASYARHTGLGLIWPRVFFTYGPGEHDSRLVASVIKALVRGLPAECSEGRQVRDYLYVGDVASGVVAALESDYCGSLDLVSGTGIAVRDLVSEVADRLGRPDLIRLGALPSKDDYPLVLGDPKEAESLLHWTPTTSLAAGLDKTISWGQQTFAQARA